MTPNRVGCVGSEFTDHIIEQHNLLRVRNCVVELIQQSGR